MSRTRDGFSTYLFHEGTNYETYKMFCPYPDNQDGVDGWGFAVWAPNASAVSVVGDFNNWQAGQTPMAKEYDGVWRVFVPGLKQFDNYKFAITDQGGNTVFKCDPYALHSETAPANASKLYDIEQYHWKDNKWMKNRVNYNPYGSPMFKNSPASTILTTDCGQAEEKNANGKTHVLPTHTKNRWCCARCSAIIN